MEVPIGGMWAVMHPRHLSKYMIHLPPSPTPILTTHTHTLSRELNDPVQVECFAQCWHSSNSHLGVWYHIRGGGGWTEGKTRNPEEVGMWGSMQ